MTTAPGHPTSELVACAWISSIPGSNITTSMVATQTPDPVKWPVVNGISQFITVMALGGTPKPLGMQAPLAMPVMEVRCWATRLDSDKPPWFASAEMCEIIRIGMYQRSLGVFGRALTVQSGSAVYNPANVIEIVMHTEPRRIYADPRSWAVYQFDMGMTWKEVNLVIDN
jgi:hypothetical protein